GKDGAPSSSAAYTNAPQPCGGKKRLRRSSGANLSCRYAARRHLQANIKLGGLKNDGRFLERVACPDDRARHVFRVPDRPVRMVENPCEEQGTAGDMVLARPSLLPLGHA